MGKLGALSILLAVALVIYFVNPNSQVEVSNSGQEIIESPQQTTSTKALNPALNVAPEDHAITDEKSESHKHIESTKSAEIPQYIQDALEAKRIPASELIAEEHSDGSGTIDLKGQFQHVPVAILGEDGKVKIVETTIQPKLDQ